MEEEKSDSAYCSISIDIALKIASSMEVSDLFPLSHCSRVWCEIWSSDSLWEPLCKERLPLLYEDALKDPNSKGWRGICLKQHRKEMKDHAESVIKFVEGYSESIFSELELVTLLKQADGLKPMGFRLHDVRMLLFKPELNVLVNLVGLHYCINILGVQALEVVEALESSKILNREVEVKCWILHRWLCGYRDGYCYQRLSLEALARPNLLSTLLQVPIDEVLRAQILDLFPQPITSPSKSYARTILNSGIDCCGWFVFIS